MKCNKVFSFRLTKNAKSEGEALGALSGKRESQIIEVLNNCFARMTQRKVQQHDLLKFFVIQLISQPSDFSHFVKQDFKSLIATKSPEILHTKRKKNLNSYKSK